MSWFDATIDILFGRDPWLGCSLLGILLMGILWGLDRWSTWKENRERWRIEGPTIAELFLIERLREKGNIDDEDYEALVAPLMEELSPLTRLQFSLHQQERFYEEQAELEMLASYLETKAEQHRAKAEEERSHAEELKQEVMKKTGMSSEQIEAIIEREETLRKEYPEFTE